MLHHTMSPQETPATAVKIAEDSLLRVRSAPDTGRPTGIAGGVYHARSLSRVSVDKRSARRLSHEPTPDVARDVEEGDNWRDGHEKKKQVFSGWTLLWLSYQSIGVIYGDIGTRSAFFSAFSQNPTTSR
jgi:KUP system potassium uptake protein